MASPNEVEITINSAKDLKNVNWRHGILRPYAVVWIDPAAKSSTNVAEEGDTSPVWNAKLIIPFHSPIHDSTLYIDIVHAADPSENDTKPLIGSAKLPLNDIVDEFGLGVPAEKNLKLKRPSGRPQGKVEVQVTVRDARYRAPDPYPAPAYGVPPPAYGNPAPPYGVPPPAYGNPAPAYGNPYGGYPGYGQPGYVDGQGGYAGSNYYGQSGQVVEDEKKKSKFGMGTGLAVGAVGGVLGGLALAEGFDALEDKIEDDVAERVEDDLGYDGDDF